MGCVVVQLWMACPPRGAFGTSPPPPAFQTGVHKEVRSASGSFNIAMRLTKYFIFGVSIDAQTFEGV